jgi:hypothetical protein
VHTDQELIDLLRTMKRLGELRKRALEWAVLETRALGCESPIAAHYLNSCRDVERAATWRDHVDGDIFARLSNEAVDRGIEWDANPPLDEPIDISDAGPLGRQLLGALYITIDAHGPITKKWANSAVKRLVGAMKTYNREVTSGHV